MGLFGNIRNAISVDGDSIAQPVGWLQRLLAMTQTSSGIVIHEANALTVGDVYKCVNVIAQTIAMQPWKIFKRLDNRGRQEALWHSLYFLLHDEPNNRMTSFTYRMALISHLLIWGRHASYIERDGSGKIVALWPLRPDLFYWEIRGGKMWFWVSTIDGIPQQFWEDEIFYIPGLTREGYNAYSPIALHRETIGLSKALEVFGAKFFGNGASVGGYLKHAGTLSKEAALRLKEDFESKHRGLDTAHRIAVLEEGMDFVPNQVKPEEAQFILTRQFQRSDLAGLWRVPPHKIGDLSRSTNNNIEHQDLEFLRDCIGPWMACIEQAANRSLLLPREKGRFFVEFDINDMLRGDTAARMAYCNGMFQTGAFSPNDILEYNGLNPVEGGDRRFVPLNMVPLDQTGDPDNDSDLNDDEDLPVLSVGAHAALPVVADPRAASIARAERVNLRFFRDVVGRTLHRKPNDRVKYVETALVQPILSLIQCLLGSISPEMEDFAPILAAKIACAADLDPRDPDWLAEWMVNSCAELILSEPAKQSVFPVAQLATENWPLTTVFPEEKHHEASRSAHL
jgi:HK97 family phage portal protein